MITIDTVVRVEPALRLPVAHDHERLGSDAARARVYGRLYGYDQIPVAAAGEEFAMLETGVRRLLAEAGVPADRVAVLVHAHTGPYIGPVGRERSTGPQRATDSQPLTMMFPGPSGRRHRGGARPAVVRRRRPAGPR